MLKVSREAVNRENTVEDSYIVIYIFGNLL